jgi:ubiquinone/menaquinone biosynthesis C-methylase UbiE
MVLDIERIDQPDATFDMVLCSHVLEHVDDRRALGEIFRILRPGGTAVLMTLVIEGWPETYENADVQSAAERDLHFGQADHVRYFGSDIRRRIAAAGFELTEFRAVEPFVARHGLMRGETVFVARRPALA